MSRRTAERSNRSPELAGYYRFSSHSALVERLVRYCDTRMPCVLER